MDFYYNENPNMAEADRLAQLYVDELNRLGVPYVICVQRASDPDNGRWNCTQLVNLQNQPDGGRRDVAAQMYAMASLCQDPNDMPIGAKMNMQGAHSASMHNRAVYLARQESAQVVDAAIEEARKNAD